MKTLTTPIVALVALLIMGCASFSTNTFRTEQTLTGAVKTAYLGYLTGLTNGTITVNADQSNSVRTARIQFSASIGTLETWRQSYETNSSAKPRVQAALDAAISSSSNFVWLVNLLKQH